MGPITWKTLLDLNLFIYFLFTFWFSAPLGRNTNVWYVWSISLAECARRALDRCSRNIFFMEKRDTSKVDSIECSLSMVGWEGLRLGLFQITDPGLVKYSFFKKIFFNWSIIALQCSVSFSCTVNCISHSYTYILSSWPLSHQIPSIHLVQS